MNKRLWYINIALAALLAIVFITGIFNLPGYPSSAKFKDTIKKNTGTGNSEKESPTIVASRKFTYWLDPPPAFGSIAVSIEPTEALEAGAAWRVGGNAWIESGQTINNITPGKKSITFKTVKGWLSPELSVEIKKDEVTSVTAVYSLPPKGDVKVTILPEEAVKLDPKWKIDDSEWLSSGTQSEKLPVGKYNIEFSEIEGWDKPQQSIAIEKDKTTEISVNYELIHYGNVSLKLAADLEQPEEARWKANNLEWQTFDSEPLKLRLGKYQISFQNVPDWEAPENFELNIDEEKTYEKEVSYSLIPYAQVTVSMTSNSNDMPESAQWKIDNGSWLNFDQIAEKVTLANHRVSFQNVSGWTTPEPLTITIDQETIYEYSCQYVKIKPPGPKFTIQSVIETGGGKGVVFLSPKEGYKVGEEIQGYTLVHVEHGKVILEKDGFEYEIKIEETEFKTTPANDIKFEPGMPPIPGERPDRPDRPGRPTPPINRERPRVVLPS